LCRGANVWAKVVPDIEAKTFKPLIYQRMKRGSIIYSDTWKSYTGIAAKGYVHRFVEHGKNKYLNKKRTHINGLKGLYGYLKTRL